MRESKTGTITAEEPNPLAEPVSSPRSTGHIAFDGPHEYFISLGAIYRARTSDSIIGGPGGPGHRPAQYVCATSDVYYDRPSTDRLLPETVLEVIRRTMGV